MRFRRELLTVVLASGCSAPAPELKDVTGCLPASPTADVPYEGPGIDRLESVFDGYGCNSVVERKGVRGIRLRPQVATKAEETHAGLVLGPWAGREMQLSCGVETLAYLRKGTPPNPHEVGWLVWHYRDNEHFYYLMVKPNGWELGKRDPAYPGGQRFLATGDRPAAAVGERRELRVAQSKNRMEVFIDGQRVSTFEDEERPYDSGRIGVYSEDADVFFDSLALVSRP